LTPANEISFVDCVNEDGEQVLHRPIEITPFLGTYRVGGRLERRGEVI
jgi:hypothetical protein